MNLHFRDGRLLAVLAAIVAAAAVAASIWLNPPSEVRARSLDQQRLQNLAQTDSAIKIYYNSHRTLPAALSALDSEGMMQTKWHDPETQRPYDYEVLSETSYRLCAVFSRASRTSDSESNPYVSSLKKHSVGRDCFEQSVGPYGKQ
jgi:type II secretory pathway pseudopilin PulG